MATYTGIAKTESNRASWIDCHGKSARWNLGDKQGHIQKRIPELLLKVTEKHQKELVRGFRAAGITIDQLSFIAGLEDDDLVDHRSKSYVRSRLLPGVKVAYYTAIGSRRWSYGLNGVQFFLPAVASVLAIGASSLFKHYAIKTLFIVGVINAFITASTMYEKMDQPGVELANARSVCSIGPLGHLP